MKKTRKEHAIHRTPHLKLTDREINDLLVAKGALERNLAYEVLQNPKSRQCLINIIHAYQNGELKFADVFHTTMLWEESKADVIVNEDTSRFQAMAGEILPKVLAYGSLSNLQQADIVIDLYKTKPTHQTWSKITESVSIKDPNTGERCQELLDELTKVRNQLVEYLIPTIKYFVNKHSKNDHFVKENKLDIIQVLTFSAVKAIECYRTDKNTILTTYAWNWFKQGLFRFREANSRDVRLPSNLYELNSKMLKARQYLETIYEREPNTEEIALYLGVPESKLHIAMNSFSSPTFFNSSKYDDDGMTVEETLCFDQNDNPEASFESTVNSTKLFEAMTKYLNTPEQYTLQLRGGMGDFQQHTLKETANVMNISLERARQYEKTAKYKLIKDGKKFLQRIYKDLED